MDDVIVTVEKGNMCATVTEYYDVLKCTLIVKAIVTAQQQASVSP